LTLKFQSDVLVNVRGHEPDRKNCTYNDLLWKSMVSGRGAVKEDSQPPRIHFFTCRYAGRGGGEINLLCILILNPLQPSDAVRKRKKNILGDILSSVLSQFKQYHPSRNLRLNYLGIFQSLKLRILMEKILSISLKLNFPPNTLGCYALSRN